MATPYDSPYDSPYDYEFYQLPSPMPSFLELPGFLKDAIATRDVRLTTDWDMFVRTPTNEVQVEPTDYVLKSSAGNFYVVPAPLFEDLAGIRANGVLHGTPRPELTPEPLITPAPPHATATPHAPHATPHAGGLAAATPLGAPPYSSSVLAKSARARAEQAAWENTPPPEADDESAADNARVEGDSERSMDTPER